MQTSCDLDEDLVTGRVAERVVDLLEVVHVEQQDRELRIAGLGQPLFDPFEELATVRQTGELIVQRVVFPASRFGPDLVDETTLFEGDARVAGDRAQDAGVGGAERADVALPVAEQDDAVDTAGSRERRGGEVGALEVGEQLPVQWITITAARRSPATGR